jgi:hypothetical protein
MLHAQGASVEVVLLRPYDIGAEKPVAMKSLVHNLTPCNHESLSCPMITVEFLVPHSYDIAGASRFPCPTQ